MDTERRTRVVVGIDDTLSGMQALRRAVAEARARGCPLHAVRASTPGPTSWYLALPDQQQAEVDAASQLVLRAFADTMGGLPDDLETEVVVSAGPPGPVLVAQAQQDNDLLVVGASRRGLWHRLRGSVTRYCVARAGCPVLVVPPPPLTRAASTRALLRELRRDLDHLTGDGPGKPGPS